MLKVKKPLSGTDPPPHLGGEHRLPSLGDHVELLDGGGQVAGGPQVGQTHEATLGPDVVVGPVVPLVGSVRGCRNRTILWDVVQVSQDAACGDQSRSPCMC